MLFKDPLQLSAAKAKSLLEKALAANSHYLPAVYLLAEILEQELNFDQVEPHNKTVSGIGYAGMIRQSC